MAVRVIRQLLSLLDVTPGTPTSRRAPLYDSATAKMVVRDISRDDVSGYGQIVDGATAAAELRSDTFTRADSASALGTPSDAGSAWVALAGTMGISSNQAYNVSGSDSLAYIESSSANVDISMFVRVVAQSTIAFRITDSANYWIADWLTAGSTLRLRYKMTGVAGGGYTTPDQIASSPTMQVGDVLRVLVIGSWIRVYVNGVMQLDHVNWRHRSATRHGISFANTSARYDNFTIAEVPADEYFSSTGKRFIATTFHNDSSVAQDEGEDLMLGESDDGITFDFKPIRATANYPARDSSLLIDPATGWYYLAYNNASVQSWPTMAYTSSFTVIRSRDEGATWENHAVVDLTSYFGEGVDNAVWAPEWFTDSDGSHYVLPCVADSGFVFSLVAVPITSLEPLTAGTPIPLDVGSPSAVIDPCLVKRGDKYRLYAKTNEVMDTWWAESTSIGGPYGTRTTVANGAHYEGPSIVDRDDLGQVWMYADKYPTGIIYRVSSDGGNTFGGDQAITSNLVRVRHGSVVDRSVLACASPYKQGVRTLVPSPIRSLWRWVQGNFIAIADGLESLNTALDGKAASSHAHAGEDITSGTVGDSRLSANVPLLDAANVFDNNQAIAGVPEEGRYFDISYDDAGDLYKVRSEISYAGAYTPRITVSTPSNTTRIESDNIQTPSLSVTGPATASSFAGDGASLTGIRVRPGGLITNKYYGPAGPFSVSTGAATANKLCYELIWVPPGETINRVGIEVTSASSAGTKARIGLYADSNGRPGAKLYDWGEVDTDSNGVKEITISQSLGGFYWLACLTQSTPTLRNVGGFDCAWLSGRDAPSNTVFNLKETYTYGTLPATATPSLDFAAMPFIFFRKV